MKILAATNNKHKIEEFRNILKDTGVEIISPSELGRDIPEIPEDGATFEENACIKALGFAKFAGMTVIADDSGLEIRALGGAPGIYSARYAETNEKRIERVLRELEEVKRRSGETANRGKHVAEWPSVQASECQERETGDQRPATSNPASKGNYAGASQRLSAPADRAARFVCVIALADPEKVIATFRGEVYGMIGFEPKGSGGFGYDPVFIPDGYDRTFAELGADIKDKISHRANALKKLDEYLKR